MRSTRVVRIRVYASLRESGLEIIMISNGLDGCNRRFCFECGIRGQACRWGWVVGGGG